MKEIQTTWIQIVVLIQFTQNIIKNPTTVLQSRQVTSFQDTEEMVRR